MTTPDRSQAFPCAFFKAPASSRENATLDENIEPNSNAAEPAVDDVLRYTTAAPPPLSSSKRKLFQCDYCREAIFDSFDEAANHEEMCEARKPSPKDAKETKKGKSDSNDSDNKVKKKKRRKSKIPDPQGTLTVSVPFNDSTQALFEIDGVCTTDVFDDPLTLEGQYPLRAKRAVKNFLRGFGKFVW